MEPDSPSAPPPAAIDFPAGCRARRARPEDAAPLLALVGRSLAAYGLRVDPAGIDRVLARIDEHFPRIAPDGRDAAQLHVIEAPDATPIGCGGFQPWDGAPTPPTCELFKMYLEPAWKGRGLGRATLSLLEREAARAGYRRIWLETNALLVEALRLYEANGYLPTDEGHVCSRCDIQLMKTLPEPPAARPAAPPAPDATAKIDSPPAPPSSR